MEISDEIRISLLAKHVLHCYTVDNVVFSYALPYNIAQSKISKYRTCDRSTILVSNKLDVNLAGQLHISTQEAERKTSHS